MSQTAPTSSVHLTAGTMVIAGVRRNWRTSLAVALGVAIATSVIIGALLVGDSMRGSLRSLTIERLGKIESVVAPGGFFSAARAAESLGVDEENLATVILFDSAVVETAGGRESRRTGTAQTIGCDEAFWRLDVSGIAPKTMPDDDSVVLTESLAKELDVDVGDLVTVRLPAEQAVPADSPLGRRDTQTEGIPRLKVVDILPDRGLARFSLSPAQATPKNIFLSRSLVGEVLEREGQANIALSSVSIDPDALSVGLEDLGISLGRVTKSFEDETVFDYYSVTSDRLLIDETAVEVITAALPKGSVTPVMTYLANAIETVDASGDILRVVPYSTISAMDSSDSLPLEYGNVEAADGTIPIVLNSWTAEKLSATVGTALRVAYFEPEVENGNEIERSFQAVVSAIVPITEPKRRYIRDREAVFDKEPTIYNDPNLTPTVPGVTDQDSINDWELPFQLTRTIERDDDLYWNNHRLTPKAFVPLADGRRLFGSRFGETTGLRIDPSAAADLATLEAIIAKATQPVAGELGWYPRPIRSAQLAASKGTTPFDGLFLALSCFVIFAAVMLIAMLFRLGLVARSRELGTLIALGLEKKQVSKLFLGEGFVIATIGVVIGVAGGIGYAFFVLAALRTFWVGAVTVPFLSFHATPLSLIAGLSIGLLIGLATLWWTLRSMLKNEAVDLLRGRDSSDQVQSGNASNSLPRITAVVLLVGAVAAGIAGALSGGQMAAVGFVGGGMLLLIAILSLVYDTLRHAKRQSESAIGYSLEKLARSNSTRSPLRSTLTIGLMATASFLIVAITAFRLQPTDEGTGGFDLVADTVQPLYEDLSDPVVQAELIGADAEQLRQSTILSFRVRSGQDASCNNLYQASEPTVFGVPDRAASDLKTFRFYASADVDSESEIGEKTAWSLLNHAAKGTEDDPIPMIIDQNTAMWSLQMVKGVGETKSFTYDNKTLFFEVVGLLENSLLQGRLLIGEQNFETAFPDISGYRFVLIKTGDVDSQKVAETLETKLGDFGFDASDAGEVLSGMMAVQNTYLRTFQSLGGLGLLLGTVGLAIAQLRNVLERRSELAVMRAIGFTQKRLAAMVIGETASLLLIGIGCGVLCAVLAVFPHAVSSGTVPPIVEPIVLVMGIVLFGLLAGLVAAIKVVRMQLLDSLRGS